LAGLDLPEYLAKKKEDTVSAVEAEEVTSEEK
jgi:hypothetical protein